MAHPYFDLPLPVAIGHRGCAGEVPENTLLSFERALERGADILESDVHLTRDGVAVLTHDDSVDRNTEGSGRVADFSWAELGQLDAGYRFCPEGDRGHPYRGQGLRIPSLEQALEAFPGARFNLELKEPADGFAERCLEIIEGAGRAPLTLLTAENDSIMSLLRHHAREMGSLVALGASLADVVNFIKSAIDVSAPSPLPMALQVPASFGDQALVTPRFVEHAHALDVQVHVWTINDVSEMRALLDLGVDGIVSDFPGRVVRAIEAHRADS